MQIRICFFLMYQAEVFVNRYIFSTCPSTQAHKGVPRFDPQKYAAEWVIDSLLSVRAPSVFSVHAFEHMQICEC